MKQILYTKENRIATITLNRPEKLNAYSEVMVHEILAALADDSIVMITGEDAKKLRELGVHNGKEMVSAMESMKETEKEKDAAIASVEKFMNLLRAAGVTGQ